MQEIDLRHDGEAQPGADVRTHLPVDRLPVGIDEAGYCYIRLESGKYQHTLVTKVLRLYTRG